MMRPYILKRHRGVSRRCCVPTCLRFTPPHIHVHTPRHGRGERSSFRFLPPQESLEGYDFASVPNTGL
jgi:hypothetical protein